MADCSICYNKIIDHPAPPEAGTEATGSFRSSCGHLFHPKCIWTWFSAQDESSCPLCRKKATELEDIRPHEKEEEELVAAVAAPAAAAPADLPVMEEGGWIRISRANFEQVIFNQGGPVGTWVAAVAEEVGFDEYGEAPINREEFELILRETGARVFSDAEWDHLMAIYPHFGTWPLPAAPVPEPAPAPETAPAASPEPASEPEPEPQLLFPDWEPEDGPSDPLADDLREAIERESLAKVAEKAANDAFQALGISWSEYWDIDDKATDAMVASRERRAASDAIRAVLSKRTNHIHIPRKELEHILQKQGGQVTADVDEMFYSREHNHKWITQTEFNQLLCKQGATLLSDAQWERLRAAFPLQTPVIGREPPMCPLEEGDEDELTRISRIAVE